MTTDPRDIGGDIAGPGGPMDRDGVVFNTERALLPDNLTAAVMHGDEAGDLVGLVIEGRVNRSPDRARLLVLLNADGVAAMVVELAGVIGRAAASGASRELVADFAAAYEARIQGQP